MTMFASYTGSSSELMGDNSTPLSHDKYTAAQYNDIVSIKVTHYSMERAEAIYSASVREESGGGMNMDDPLGGLSSNSSSSSSSNSKHPVNSSSSILPCTEDQVCDLEECIVTIRRCLRAISTKVSPASRSLLYTKLLTDC